MSVHLPSAAFKRSSLGDSSQKNFSAVFNVLKPLTTTSHKIHSKISSILKKMFDVPSKEHMSTCDALIVLGGGRVTGGAADYMYEADWARSKDKHRFLNSKLI